MAISSNLMSNLNTLSGVRQHHSLQIRHGLSTSLHHTGRLIHFLANSPSGSLPYALRLLSTLPCPDAFIFNTILSSPYSPLPATAQLYSLMLSNPNHTPNSFTFPSLLTPITLHCHLPLGNQIHAHVFKLGFHREIHSLNSLLHFYLECQLPTLAHRIFTTMEITPDVVSWTTLVAGFSKLGLVAEARELFNQMPVKNSVSWNAMIAGYVQNGSFREAFVLFDEMMSEGVVLDRYVSASMLSACTGIGALEKGRWIHGELVRNGIVLDPKLATTVIDMYCKCGCLEEAYEVFRGLHCKGLASWNCMIGGFATHGRGDEALELFREMEREMVVPDAITLLNVLTACAHTGRVDEGMDCFKYMVETYGIVPTMEHYGCLVDLYGRAGRFEEAHKIIEEMPMCPDAGVLGALLGACKIHGNVELGEQVGRRVIELDPHNSGRYVLLANLFASVGRWDDVADVRRLMNDRGVNKEAGCSVIELCGGVHEFIAGGISHPRAKEIYGKVDEMLHKIWLSGYKPDTTGVLHDIDEDEKENPLYFHSEKLAIAFGLLHTVRGQTIRISKNLRVCRDCHTAGKLISRVYDREIILRDRSRFHHFKEGECSCKDYW